MVSTTSNTSSSTPSTTAPAASGVVRRWILYAILYVLVTLAASGIGALISWAIDTDPDKGNYALANWLAYALIAGPLAVLLWWFIWRRLDAVDRASYAWPLYLTLVYVYSLIVFSVSILSVISGLITNVSRPWEPIGMAIAWGAVWVLHRWMLRHTTKHPLRLATLPLVLSAAWGLGVMAFNAVRMLQTLFEQAFGGFAQSQFGSPWWAHLLGALVWLLGGVAIWWWHWRRDGVHALRGGFADVALLISGVFAGAFATLFAAGTLLWIAMRALWDPAMRGDELVTGISTALAILAIAAPIWLYHRRAALARGERTRSAVRLIESGVGMVGLASGLGVVVNAALASLATPLAGGGARTLLFQGLAALIVGGVAWFLAWKPLRVDEGAGDPARRVYLVVIFGASAIAALSALLMIGFRLFELALNDGGSVIERVRSPLGVLVATALVAGYHFAIWRRDRERAPSAASPEHRIGQLVYVGRSDDPEFAQAVASATGARVTIWSRRDAGTAVATDAVIAALDGVSANRVLVVTGTKGEVEVIPLEG